MNREIKFRAWHKDCMKYSGNGYELATLFDYFSLDEDTSLMQSTGLIDKNHKEIYEGDIIGEKQRDFEDNIFVCKWDKELARFVFCSPYDGDILDTDFVSDFEILGNVYENSKLLA